MRAARAISWTRASQTQPMIGLASALIAMGDTPWLQVRLATRDATPWPAAMSSRRAPTGCCGAFAFQAERGCLRGEDGRRVSQSARNL
jgi:hypothetical protein